MPPIHEPSATASFLETFLTDALWQEIFPYSKASACFTHDNQPFWRREDFIAAVKWLNGHPNKAYHNFGSDSPDPLINKLEICSFLANTHQETGDPSLTVPYPWGWPKATPQGHKYEGPGGGCMAICEGVCPIATFGDQVMPGVLTGSQSLTESERQILGVTQTIMNSSVGDLSPMSQPNFGLGAGTGSGAVFQPGLVAVADDGTLYGDQPLTRDPEERESIRPSSEVVGKPITDRKYSALGVYGRYGGRGAIQLSYNYNYSECSIALFGDYRLARFPNLIVTTDRENHLGISEYFGFPGPNPQGKNKLPSKIDATTPPARILAWLTCLWFWMDNRRSGRFVSCHEAMSEPFRMGITTCNMIINNDSGCSQGTWAWKKNRYYERVCRIMGIPEDIVVRSIICPPAREAFRL
jgi:hypothetical protein